MDIAEIPPDDEFLAFLSDPGPIRIIRIHDDVRPILLINSCLIEGDTFFCPADP